MSDQPSDQAGGLTPDAPSGDGAAVLEVRNLMRSYPGVVAVGDMSMELRSGQILGLVGPNGAGKSTVIKMLAGAVTRRSWGCRSCTRNSPTCPTCRSLRTCCSGCDIRTVGRFWTGAG
jgi:ABC-type glutathione transport system ATPase component